MGCRACAENFGTSFFFIQLLTSKGIAVCDRTYAHAATSRGLLREPGRVMVPMVGGEHVLYDSRQAGAPC